MLATRSPYLKKCLAERRSRVAFLRWRTESPPQLLAFPIKNVHHGILVANGNDCRFDSWGHFPRSVYTGATSPTSSLGMRGGEKRLLEPLIVVYRRVRVRRTTDPKQCSKMSCSRFWLPLFIPSGDARQNWSKCALAKRRTERAKAPREVP